LVGLESLARRVTHFDGNLERSHDRHSSVCVSLPSTSRPGTAAALVIHLDSSLPRRSGTKAASGFGTWNVALGACTNAPLRQRPGSRSRMTTRST
jgi:hypothetical protein